MRSRACPLPDLPRFRPGSRERKSLLLIRRKPHARQEQALILVELLSGGPSAGPAFTTTAARGTGLANKISEKEGLADPGEPSVEGQYLLQIRLTVPNR